jgi:hypothetical protein
LQSQKARHSKSARRQQSTKLSAWFAIPPENETEKDSSLRPESHLDESHLDKSRLAE